MKVALFLSVLFCGNATAMPQPKIESQTRWRPMAAVSQRTANGLRVAVLRQTDLPIVHLVGLVTAGSDCDPEDKPGLANAVAEMLEEGGAASYTRSTLTEALADLGGDLDVEVDQNGVRLTLSTTARHFDRALELMAALMTRPRFEGEEWTREREALISELLKERAEPERIADEVFDRVIFGDGHPYAHSPDGTEAGLRAINVADLRAFYSTHYGPRTTTLLLVGDAPRDAALRVERAFADWKSNAVPAAPPRAATPGAARLVIVDRPGATQSELRIGHVGVASSTSDYAALQLLKTVLGGSFTSRLNQNLRERHGYTYGAHARFKLFRAPGSFDASAAVRTDVTAPAVREILSELEGILKGPTREELRKGRSLLIDQLVETFGHGLLSAQFLGKLLLADLPVDHWQKALDDLDALDVAKTTLSAQRLFFPDRLVIVVVGDRKKIEKSLRALPMVKTVEFRDANGELTR